MTDTIRRKEHRKIIQLQATPAAKYYSGEHNSHYYSVKTDQNLMCLVVYNRQRWMPTDIPLKIITNAAVCKTKHNNKLMSDFVDVHVYSHSGLEHVEFDFNETIIELKNWLDEFAQRTSREPAYVARMMDQTAFFSKVNDLYHGEENRCENRRIDEQIAELQMDVADITAKAGQNLLTAYSHATRARGAHIWDQQYYNFPE